MHLQLLQLTCKCGHLHLGRRGRRSGRQGGAAEEPAASQAQSLPPTSNQGPSCQPVTAPTQVFLATPLSSGPLLYAVEGRQVASLLPRFVL